MPTGADGGGALAGIRVLDMTEGIAGPFASSMLGDLGADVVKIERPQGDWGRATGRVLEPEFTSIYVAMNRNKRSLGLDLRTDSGREVIERLVESSHVILSNYRPGVLDSLGLSFERCSQMRPGVVYCTISAFDPTGLHASRRGNDTGLQAESGLMNLIGEPNGPPLRVAVPVVDLMAGLYASQAVAAAMVNTDSPRRLDVSLLNVAAVMQTIPMTEYLNTGTLPTRQGNQNAFISPAGAFATADGRFVTISCLREKHWSDLCVHLGRPELTHDPRFADNSLRITNRRELNVELGPLFATRTLAEWIPVLSDADILHAPVNDYTAFFQDPGLGDVAPVAGVHVGASTYRTMTNPVRFDGNFPSVKHNPPARGEHTGELLASLGYSEDEQTDLRDGGAVTDAALSATARRTSASQA